MDKREALRVRLEASRRPTERLGQGQISCMRACMGYEWCLQDTLSQLDKLSWQELRDWLESDRRPAERLARGEFDTITCMRASMGYEWCIQDILDQMDKLDSAG